MKRRTEKRGRLRILEVGRVDGEKRKTENRGDLGKKYGNQSKIKF